MIGHMGNKKIIFVLLPAIIALGLAFPFPRINAQENLKSTLKEVEEKVGEISDIENNESLAGEERIQKETEARKEALAKIFDLTLLEDQDLKNKLNDLKNLTENQEKMRSALLVIFTENENAYAEMRKRLAEAKTLEEIKQLAADFKIWRSAVYNPKVDKIISFILIFRQKNVLQIAKSRLSKIQADLIKLESAKLLSPEDTKELLESASENIQIAEDLRLKAEELVEKAINQDLSPEIALKNEAAATTTSKSEIASKKSDQAEQATEELTPKKLIEESLGNVKSAYKHFISISDTVKKKLGIK